MLRRIWPAMDVKFVPHEQIGRKLRYDSHACGNRLSIQYVFETDWSKSFSDKTSTLDGSEVPNFEILQQACNEVFEDHPFVYLVNKDREKQLKADHTANGTQLPNSPWGLNSFQDFHNVSILSALNPTPPHLGFLDHLCQNNDTVRDALFHSQIYQAVMRTSLRDIDAADQVQVLVPDRSSAVALGKYFPGCSCDKLPLGVIETTKRKMGRPAVEQKKCGASTKRKADQRRRAIDKEIKRIIAGGAVDHVLVAEFERACRADNTSLIKLQQLIV
jgi:hypothetical protein